MFSLKGIVGKLWLTIIGLVAVVLLVLGLFLSQYLETSFPKSQDQIENLRKLGQKVTSGIALHNEDERYIDLVNDLLSAQDATVFVVDVDLKPMKLSSQKPNSMNLQYDDFFRLSC